MYAIKEGSIVSYAHQVAALLPDTRLAQEVRRAFDTEQAALDKIETLFQKLTSKQWSEHALRTFFHGWRDTHLTSQSVAALTLRLLTKGEVAESTGDMQAAKHFNRSAQLMAKIIHEDVGLAGEVHSDLYTRLADKVCGTDEWQLSRYRVQGAFEFRHWVQHQRISSKDFQDGFLTTIASEIYNHGEYSMILPYFKNWLENVYSFAEPEARRSLAYIVVHTGETESSHFMHGVDALNEFCTASGIELDYGQLGNMLKTYLHKAGQAFENIALELDLAERGSLN